MTASSRVPKTGAVGKYRHFVSRTPPETDEQFSEPGLFVINPEGKAHVIDISNAPFARPDLPQVLNGIKFAREKKFPVRGTVD